MASFEELCRSVTPQVRRLLDFIWDHYLTKGTWPTNRVIYGEFKKEELVPLLGTLDGSLVREVESNGHKALELPLLGILNTSKGEVYLALLKRYLEYLRTVYFRRQDVDSVKHTEVQKELKLTAEETAMLGRLVFSGFLQASGGYQPNFTEWGLNLPAELENLPSSGELDNSFKKILDGMAGVRRSVFLADRIAALGGGLSEGPSPAPTLPDEGSHNPVVLISYSHDDKDHKRWTLALAQRLYEAGIDIIIDQWDLGAGDDIAKFMEKSVRHADRVLMICTEAYVKKVNEGTGGAGYEGMIVTSELIKNLGTAKFIPIIRQAVGKHEVPTCVSTRSWIDLSEGSETDEELKKLIRNLRKEPPPTKPSRHPVTPPPPEGTPAPTYAAAAPAPPAAIQPPPATASSTDNPTTVYQHALALASAGDLVQWRKLVTAKKSSAEDALKAWRETAVKNLPTLKTQLPGFALGGVTTQQTLFAIALAGVESGQPKFNQQAGLVFDLMKPRGWERSGFSLVGDFPDTNAFVFQSLLGAMAIYSGQSLLALDLATQRITDRYNTSQSRPLFLYHPLAGWPEAFETNCTVAWQFLWQLPDAFPWIVDAFNGAESFRECLCGYYILLSWLEFLELLRGGANIDETQDFRPAVPALFLRSSEHSAGARKLLEDREPLQKYSLKTAVDIARQTAAWPNWVANLSRWVGRVYHDPFDSLLHSELIHFATDLHR
jgi:hypothetical protein